MVSERSGEERRGGRKGSNTGKRLLFASTRARVWCAEARVGASNNQYAGARFESVIVE
jgi:hypothetical protein